MAVKELSSPPGSLSLYARAAAPMIPGVSKLPFFAGGGGEMPDLELRLEEVEIDRAHLAQYARVCEFRLGDALPATYPHMLAFPLHMGLMTDSSFPFPAVGLVHLSNRITQHRPIAAAERLSLAVKPTATEPHPKGTAFSIVTEARSGGEVVWDSSSTMLRRGGGDHGSGARPADARPPLLASPEGLRPSATWKLDSGLGRRYGAASGDRNPIHMHDLTAKALGFPRAIAHGMWTKARCLAALEGRLPDAYTAEVAFRKPILLPAKVEFASESSGAEIRFAVRTAEKDTPHLEGAIR